MPTLLLLRSRLLGLVLLALIASYAHASSTFYVDAVNGSDSNSGLSPSSAFQTISRAQTAVRAINSNMSSDIYVYLANGVYTQTATLTMTPADSGSNGYYVHYAAQSGATPEISGGQPISGWTAVTGKPYWVATLPAAFPSNAYFRQLYVDGRRATLAGQTAYIQASSQIVNGSNQVQGLTFTTSQVHTAYHNLTDVRLVHYESFKADYLPIVSMSVSGSTVSLYTQQPYTAFRGARGFFDAASNWVIQNDIEDLSQPGQWYLDQPARLVYYYPRAGETLTGSGAAQVMAPVVDTVLSVFGNGSQVTNLSFEGLTFEYGNWLVPQTSYFGGSQAEALFLPNLSATASIPSTNGYLFQMPGEVTLNQTNNIHFIGNTFRHSGDCGLDIYNAATNTLVQGNVTYDTTGAGIVLGQLYSLYGDVPNYPWNYSNLIPNQGQNSYTTIEDNLVSDTGSDFYQATGISLMNPLQVNVTNNTVYHTAYMGIHSRSNDPDPSQTDKNATAYVNITYNRVLDGNWSLLKDNGAIYSYGLTQFVVIDHNFMYQEQSIYGTYIDNDSIYDTISNNVSAEKIFHSDCAALSMKEQQNISYTGNYTTASVANECQYVPPSTDVQVSSSSPWPSAAQAIINSSGLPSNYLNLIASLPPLPSLATGLIYGKSPSSDSGGWTGLQYLTDGSPLTNEASNSSSIAWVQYDLPSPITGFTFNFQTDFNGTYETTAWKVQYYNSSTSTWVDFMPYQNITTSLPVSFSGTSSVPTNQIRLYLENTHTGGLVGATEFTVNPTN